MWWLILPGILLLWIVILVIRAILFVPAAQQAPEPDDAPVDAARAAASLAEMVRCKTVSFRQEGLADEREFEKFRALLGRLYPRVHAACECERVGPSGILYRLKGRSAAHPAVLMSHYDVVPADEAAWDKPAFDGLIEDGVLWGRGTLDTKATLCGVMEAAETLLGEGFVPDNDLYFAFSGDEEVTGDSAPAIVRLLEQRGVVPALVVDEGGAVVDHVFPGVAQPCALIGIAEKGMLDVSLTVATKGGHASSPPPHTAVGILAKAVCAIENRPFRGRLTKPVAEMFDTLGRHSNFAYRLLFANLWCFLPLLCALSRKTGGEMNALMRTTCAFTMMEGSKAANVLPPAAKVAANLRLLDGTADDAVAYLEKTAGDDRIAFEAVYSMNPSPCSETQGEGWEKLRKAVAQTWPDALISPYLMVACSDSRHYCRISNYVYRFSAMALTKAERSLIHGHNERIPLEKITKTVQFYIRLIKQC